MLTPLGLLFLAVIVVLAITRGGAVRVLALAGGLPMGAAAVISGEPIPMFYAVAIGAITAAAVRALLLRRERVFQPTGSSAPRPRLPGAVPLLLFAVWSALITLIGPTLFAGIPVLVSRGGLDEQLLDPGRLEYSVSNLAQVVYMAIGIGTVFLLGRGKSTTPMLLGIALATVTTLSFWRLISIITPLWFPEGFFDNSPNVRLIETTSDGGFRFRGIFSEPSGLAGVSLTTAVLFAMEFRRFRGWRRMIPAAVIAMAAVNAVSSTATTLIAAGLIVAAILLAVGSWRFVTSRVAVGPGIAAVALVVVGAGAFLAPAAVDLISTAVGEKIDSTSYGSRTGVDLFSYDLALQTFGLGTGLGSNRPSSFLAMLLSCVGIPGTVLFAAAIVGLVRGAWRDPRYRSTVWALIALLVNKLLVGPNLSDPSATLWICLGIVAHGAWSAAPASGGPVEVPTGAPGVDVDQTARRARMLRESST